MNIKEKKVNTKKIFNLDDHQEDVLFIPLGGCNQIGINLYLYCYKGKILVVDFGSGFFQEHGVEIGVPKIDFLIENKHRIIGIFITHAHEDHIGAIQYLWKFLKIKLYTSQFTANFIHNKMQENSTSVNIEILHPDKKHIFKPFSIELVPLTHSCLDMYGLAIYGPHGILFHTGDWKYDPDPVVGHMYDTKKLKEMSEYGVQAMMCDSTNVFSKGHSGSEGEVQKSLLEMISKMKNMVVVTTFASNFARLKSLVFIARKLNKKVLFAGRSMFRMILAANQTGYDVEVGDIIIEDADLESVPRDKLMVICTGCQGEPSAALTKIILGKSNIKLSSGDNVIFSSKNIPGNEKKVFTLLDKLVRKKINIRTSLDYFVHVSGHPNIDELKSMYEVVKPNCVVPVHGETYHVFKQASLAKSLGVKHSIAINNGDVLLMKPDYYKVIGSVTSGVNVLDGKRLVDLDSKVFSYRKSLSSFGVISLFIAHENFKVLKNLQLYTYGILDIQTDFNMLLVLKHKLSEDLKYVFQADYSLSKSELEDKIKSSVKTFFSAKIGKSPVIIMHIYNNSHK